MRPLRPTDPPEVGAFRLDGILGEGSQGTAYLATGPDGRLVALKLLHAHLVGDAEAQQRFLREVDVATRVARFCTAQVLATGTALGRPYIISEYVSGPTLENAVMQRGPRQGGALDRLAIGTATALAAIHRAGVLHRDFKPANVIVSPEGPVVVDFGIARALGSGGRTGLTQTGITVGTPAFMAPEQISDQEPGPPADIFSWACTMVFAATAQSPFRGSSVAAMFEHILHGEPDLGTLGGQMRDVVTACLAKDPGRRPAAEELVAWLTGDAVPAHTTRPDAAAVPAHVPQPDTGGDIGGHAAEPGDWDAEQWRKSSVELDAYMSSGGHTAAADGTGPAVAATPASTRPGGDRAGGVRAGGVRAASTRPGGGLPGDGRAAGRGPGRKRLLVTLAIAVACAVAGGGAYALAGQGTGKASADGAATSAGTGRASAAVAVTSSPAQAANAAAGATSPASSPAPPKPKPPTPTGPDLVVNGNFAGGVLAPWFGTGGTLLEVSGGPHRGDHVLEMSSAGGGSGAEQVISGLRPGVTYELTGWVASTRGAETWLGVKLYAAPSASSGHSTTSTHWTQVTVFFTPGPGHRTAHVFCWRKPKGTGYCTGIVVRALR